MQCYSKLIIRGTSLDDARHSSHVQCLIRAYPWNEDAIPDGSVLDVFSTGAPYPVSSRRDQHSTAQFHSTQVLFLSHDKANSIHESATCDDRGAENAT